MTWNTTQLSTTAENTVFRRLMVGQGKESSYSGEQNTTMQGMSLGGNARARVALVLRSAEIRSQSHPLMLQLKDNEDCGIKTTTLEVGNLSQDSVLALIAEVLRMDGHDDAVSTLATTIYKKTDGVAFYVLVFLKSIYDEDMLQFNFGTMRYPSLRPDEVATRGGEEPESNLRAGRATRQQRTWNNGQGKGLERNVVVGGNEVLRQGQGYHQGLQ